MDIFEYRKKLVEARYEELVTRTNKIIEGNGVYNRYCNPVITAEMVPPFWKYDYDRERNPYFMERIGVNATLNAGAIKLNGRYPADGGVWKATTASRSSPWLRALMVSTISAFGITR